ncbi:MAG: hypothetical protein AAB871_02735 [Patescibacteria group bacterium]
MLKKLLIIAIATIAVLGVAILIFRNQSVSPLSTVYKLKLAGEWLDVNFLTFGAPEKQVKHLVFAQRRLDEFKTIAGEASTFHIGTDYKKGLEYAKSLDQPLIALSQSYKTELTRAYFMAEQLALLDHKFIPMIEEVYKVSFQAFEKLVGTEDLQAYRQLFEATAQEYNRQAIKNLLQKHQDAPEDTLRYKSLVELWLGPIETKKNSLTPDELQTLNKAKLILSQGREIEWAYDLLSSIGF